jgi:hypothetical protein
MQPQFGIATVLCLTATLLVGCALGHSRPEERGLSDRASGAGTLVAQSTGRIADESEARSEEGERLERAAAFHDYGRYYK